MVKAEMTTTNKGRKAELAVVSHLESLGHKILSQNYRTRHYEIDVVSKLGTDYGNKIFFTEVKYRKSSAHGDGISHITPKKLQKMRFAAEDFLDRRRLREPAALAAASVAGEDFKVQEWFEIEE